MTRHRTYPHLSRGFTMMEATIALGLLLLGVLGMGALAAASIRTNMEAQDRTQATNLLNLVLEQVRTEAMGWNNATWNTVNETPDPNTYFPTLNQLPGNPTKGGSSGVREYTGDRLANGTRRAFTYDLRLIDPALPGAKFCVHYQMTWLNPNESARADVRVYWMRRGSDPAAFGFYNNCGLGNTQKLATNMTDVRCVAGSTILMRHSRGDLI
jgi:type II secretory pathway pseudopilin PulG